jgi:hypothetical protein
MLGEWRKISARPITESHERERSSGLVGPSDPSVRDRKDALHSDKGHHHPLEKATTLRLYASWAHENTKRRTRKIQGKRTVKIPPTKTNR